MSKIEPELLYTKEHEWLRKTQNAKTVVVGITDYAQASLGDITFVELPEVGKTLKQNEIFGSVESVKSVSELFSPVSGSVVKTNTALNEDPAPINQDPYTSGWLMEIELSDESELQNLLNAQAYEAIAQ